MLSRKYYEMIARVVGKINDPARRAAVAGDFLSELRADNPNFVATRFLAAVEKHADDRFLEIRTGMVRVK